MKLPVIFRRLARAEFDDAADWYEARSSGQGAIFTAAVRRVLAGLAARPEAHPEVYEDVREALVYRFPYAVYYRPEPNRRAGCLSHLARSGRVAEACRVGTGMAAI